MCEKWRRSWSQYSNQFVEEISLNNRGSQGRLKVEDSEAMLQAVETNPASSKRRVLVKLTSSLSSVVHPLHNLSKSIRSCRIVPHVTKI